jgi:hypothetical protein
MPTVAPEGDEDFDDMEVDRTTIANAADVKVDDEHLQDVESGDEEDQEEDDEELDCPQQC